MKNSIVAVGLTTLLLVGCNAIAVRGSGEAYEVTHPIEPITSVEVNGNGELRIQNGSRNELIVLAQKEIHQFLSVQQRGDLLIIEPEEGYRFRTDESLRYLLITDGISELDVSGAVTVTSDEYRTESLMIEASGAIDLDMVLFTDDLTIDASGAFDGYLSGETRSLNLDFSGASDLNAYDMPADDVNLDLSGAGTIFIMATERLNVRATGASRVTYKGSPRVSQTSAGTSSVTSAE